MSVGDLTGDNIVDVLDLAMVGMAYGSCAGETSYVGLADLNIDGLVDMRDVSTVARNYGKNWG